MGLVTRGYRLRINLQINLQSLETSLILKKFSYVVTILSNSATTPAQP